MLFGRIKKVLFGTELFFRSLVREKSFKEVIYYYLKLMGIVLPINYLVTIFTTDDLLVSTIVYFVFLIVGIAVFIIAVLTSHLFIYLLDGRQGLLRTVQAYIYGNTSGLLLSFIPFVNILAGLYSVYLTVKGIIILHNMKWWKALLAYFMPLLCLLCISGIISSILIIIQ